MIPGKLNLLCPQGSTFTRNLIYKLDETPINLTGYNARLQVREFSYSPEFVLGFDSSESLDNIYTGGSSGTIDIYIQPELTKGLVPGKYVYDLEIYTSSNVYRILQGNFTVTAEVTR
jgi:hypothetical protein